MPAYEHRTQASRARPGPVTREEKAGQQKAQAGPDLPLPAPGKGCDIRVVPSGVMPLDPQAHVLGILLARLVSVRRAREDVLAVSGLSETLPEPEAGQAAASCWQDVAQGSVRYLLPAPAQLPWADVGAPSRWRTGDPTSRRGSRRRGC